MRSRNLVGRTAEAAAAAVGWVAFLDSSPGFEVAVIVSAKKSLCFSYEGRLTLPICGRVSHPPVGWKC